MCYFIVIMMRNCGLCTLDFAIVQSLNSVLALSRLLPFVWNKLYVNEYHENLSSTNKIVVVFNKLLFFATFMLCEYENVFIHNHSKIYIAMQFSNCNKQAKIFQTSDGVCVAPVITFPAYEIYTRILLVYICILYKWLNLHEILDAFHLLFEVVLCNAEHSSLSLTHRHTHTRARKHTQSLNAHRFPLSLLLNRLAHIN